LFPANSVGDDIEIYDPIDQSKCIYIQRSLRQQLKKAPGQPNIALSDFIAPKSSGIKDYIGGFVVTTGIGLDEIVEKFEADNDSYNSILIKAIADRLAEAMAEYMHEFVRTDLWAYAKDEGLSNADLIKEKYKGIRPAPGYPACPDHQEKTGLFSILNAQDLTGVTLTETLAMLPASSVSGWYFAHPQSKYFGLGKIAKDQLEDLAKRKGTNYKSIERWYTSIINE